MNGFLEKKDSYRLAIFLGEGIFTMGYSKKYIYNVLGGFYGYYNSMSGRISVHKLHIFLPLKLYKINSTLVPVLKLVLKFCTNDCASDFPIVFMEDHFPVSSECQPLIPEHCILLVLFISL